MHGMIWRYNGVLGNCSIARSWVLSLLHVNRSLSQRRMNMRNVFIPFILLLLPTRLRQRAYRTSHVQNPYTFHFRSFIFPGVFIQVSTSPSYRKNAYTHTSARLVVHQRPFSIPLSTSKHHHNAVYKKYSPRPPLPAGTARL